MERFRKFWNRIRLRVINGLLIAALILVTIVLILPDSLANFVTSTSILVRLLILGFLYIPVILPVYRLVQQRRNKKPAKVNAPEQQVSRPPSASVEAPINSVKDTPKPIEMKPTEDVSSDLNIENEDDFYTMLQSMPREESQKQD